MKKLLLAVFLQSMPLIAIADEVVLGEEIARFVIADLSDASQNSDIERMRKYVDSESRFIWKTSIEGGTDGKEANGDLWLAFMEFFAPTSEDSDSQLEAQILSIEIDPVLNQATVIESLTAVYPLYGVTYEEKATEMTVLGVRNGSVKVIYWERNTSAFTEIE